MPESRTQPRMLVVHDCPDVVGEVSNLLAGWWIGVADHGDLAIDEAVHVDVVLVDLSREPVDGWFVLARLASEVAVVAVGSHRQASRALRLGATAFATSFAALGGALDQTLVA